MAKQKLLTLQNLKDLPPLYSTEEQGENAMVIVKFFLGSWTWYATEFNPETGIFFGLVVGLATELGYFSLAELQQLRGQFGLPVERDMYFTPKTLTQVRAEHSR